MIGRSIFWRMFEPHFKVMGFRFRLLMRRMMGCWLRFMMMSAVNFIAIDPAMHMRWRCDQRHLDRFG